ncbi:MAG: universal stress protein [Burkholderiaceae bacterium]
MYQRILVPIDGSATAARGLAEAIQLARLTRGRLRLIHVVDELSLTLGVGAGMTATGDLLNLVREAGAATLVEGSKTVQAAGIEVDTVLKDSFAGRIYELVVAEAASWPADLIVVGTHGRRGVERLVLGSDAENISRHAQTPVLLVRDMAPNGEAADA